MNQDVQFPPRYVVYEKGKIIPCVKTYFLCDAVDWVRDHQGEYSITHVKTGHVFACDGEQCYLLSN